MGQGHGKVTKRFLQSWSSIVPDITFLLQIVFFRAKTFSAILGHYGAFFWVTWPMFEHRQDFDTMFLPSLKSVIEQMWYRGNDRPGWLDKKLHTLGSRSQKGHQKPFPVLKLDCAKYQVCTTNNFSLGIKNKFSRGGGSGNGLNT